jgi:hypothetical protein
MDFSLILTDPFPCLRGGMGFYQSILLRASAFFHLTGQSFDFACLQNGSQAGSGTRPVRRILLPTTSPANYPALSTSAQLPQAFMDIPNIPSFH